MPAGLVMASRIVPEGGHRLKPFRTPSVKKASHLVFIKRLPCVCCWVRGIQLQADDPMHLRSASALHGKPEETGGGRKPDDRWTLPGCRPHHDEQHHEAELAFWTRYGIDPHLLALVLWGLTGDDYAALEAIRVHATLRPALRTA